VTSLLSNEIYDNISNNDSNFFGFQTVRVVNSTFVLLNQTMY